MYAYMYTYICICVYIYIYTHMCVCVCVCIYLSLSIYIYIYIVYSANLSYRCCGIPAASGPPSTWPTTRRASGKQLVVLL